MSQTEETTTAGDRPPFNPLEGCAWPDPDPSPDGKLRLNDVSGLSEYSVDAIYFPRTEEDVTRILELAVANRRRVIARGTQHSMGGHCLVESGMVVDTKYLNWLSYDETTELVTTGVGCTWANLIAHLNQYQKSPVILQSYCNFSVGGTLSVNAHGITSDFVLAESVVHFRLARVNRDGRVEIVTCSRPSNDGSSEPLTESGELFGLVLGGYGLFGIVTECTLKVTDNHRLVMDSLSRLSVISENENEPSEFERIYHACRKDPSVDIKLARLNILNLETASLYLFRKCNTTASSNLAVAPKEMSYTGRLLYKWALPLLKEYRQYTEDATGKALDMPEHNQETTRNVVLWESALPLAKLYSPLVICNDTFILQEFFVPMERFGDWIHQARSVYQDIDHYQRHGSDKVPAQSLILLNTTIRFIEKDTSTLLSYSSAQNGSFSFVLYYRIKRSRQVEDDLGVFHNRLSQVAVNLGGTFYLPYRKCYTETLLAKGYPQISEFARRKEFHDPMGVFSNDWFERYFLPRCCPDYRARWKSDRSPGSFLPLGTKMYGDGPELSEEEFLERLPRRANANLERRSDSYRVLLRDHSLRKRFCEEFLGNVFNIFDPPELMRLMSVAAWDPRNQNDVDIYCDLVERLQQASSSLGKLRQGWRAIRQLSRQKAELTHQTALILHRLGCFGRIQKYLSIGDHGKTVRSCHEAGIFDNSRPTQVVIAHDFASESEQALSTVLERASMEPIGDVRIQFDYSKDNASDVLSAIPSDSMDLVTLNQGLHHFPIVKLYGFLLEIYRVLRHDGAFIFREHDLLLPTHERTSTTAAPVAMLDLAHSVFNAVTGASKKDEEMEIRAFRPLAEWREIMALAGFEDTMLFGFEPDDSTCDFMMCFRKRGLSMIRETNFRAENVLSNRTCLAELKLLEPPIMTVIKSLLAQVPIAVTDTLSKLVALLVAGLPIITEMLSNLIRNKIPQAVQLEVDRRNSLSTQDFPDDIGKTMNLIVAMVTEHIVGKLEKLLDIGAGAQDLLRDITVRETSDIAGLLSTPEIWLILPALKRQQKSNPDSVGELEKFLLGFVETYFPILFDLEPSHPSRSDILQAPVSSAVSANVEPVLLNGPVDTNDVLSVILRISNGIPGLLDPTVVMAESGFSLTQQSALLTALAAPDLTGLAEKIAGYHDQQSWQALRSILVGTGDSVLETKDLPTQDRLLSREINHPWRQALKAFLMGPNVHLKAQAKFGLRVVQLHEFIFLYDEAKQEAQEKSKVSNKLCPTATLSLEESMILDHRVKQVCHPSALKEVEFHFDVENAHDLFDVGEIVSARFGYVSITSRLTDVTQELKAFHENMQHQLASHVSDSTSPSVGWLPIRESTLTAFRNDGSVAKLSDSMRQAIVSTGTLGFKGGNVLKLSYIPLVTTIEKRSVDDLCDFAQRKRFVQSELHKNDGHYTWLKLSEWMQVEIMYVFTKSLDHTPWYHFPFNEMLAEYFRILFAECSIVAREHGLVKAYASLAFATDLIPGIVMSILFGQLQLIGYPLRRFLPAYDSAVMTEEILVIASSFPDDNLLFNLRHTIDTRIKEAEQLCRPEKTSSALYKLVVPTFKAMGEILVKIGECHASARILQISNQKTIQVCLAVNLEEPTTAKSSQDYIELIIADINRMEGLQVVLHYCYPMDAHALRLQGEDFARTVHIAVKAEVPNLLDLVRMVTRYQRVEVKQIYDFWSG